MSSALSVFISKFGILERPLRGWFMEDTKTLVDCCIILHNMTIEYRCVNFVYNNLHYYFEEEVNRDNDCNTIFPENENEIGEDLNDA